MSYHDSFERYIDCFLQSFSIDDVEKFDLYSNKNLKYLFYRFYIKAYRSKRNKIKHTQKIKNTIGMQKIEERNKKFLVEIIIHSVEFSNPMKILLKKSQKYPRR